jgi:hypothetical protein
MHTHESSQPCDVLGADDVTDTPPNQQIDAYADAAGNLAALSGNSTWQLGADSVIKLSCCVLPHRVEHHVQQMHRGADKCA